MTWQQIHNTTTIIIKYNNDQVRKTKKHANCPLSPKVDFEGKSLQNFVSHTHRKSVNGYNNLVHMTETFYEQTDGWTDGQNLLKAPF